MWYLNDGFVDDAWDVEGLVWDVGQVALFRIEDGIHSEALERIGQIHPFVGTFKSKKNQEWNTGLVMGFSTSQKNFVPPLKLSPKVLEHPDLIYCLSTKYLKSTKCSQTDSWIPHNAPKNAQKWFSIREGTNKLILRRLCLYCGSRSINVNSAV